MGTQVLALVLAAASAFVCAACALRSLAGAYRSRKATLAAQGIRMTPANYLAWRLRNGFDTLMPQAGFVLRSPLAANLADEAVILCADRGFTATRESVVSIALAAAAVFAVAVGTVTSSAVAAIAVTSCLCAIAVMAAGTARDRRLDGARDAVPAALESMASCFSSGFTLQQTFEQVAHDIEGPLSDTFARSAHILEMGGGADRALGELKRGSCADELAFVAVALDVQHQSGGAMRQVLDAATETVKGELALKRSLRVQTAQAKLSARIVVVMPFLLIGAFSIASPDFLDPFFESVAGYALLGLAVVMQVAGILLVRRALAVEGVS